jgi:hypothetical protein
MSEVKLYNQPPGWATAEAADQLGEGATWQQIAELAWDLVQRDEA